MRLIRLQFLYERQVPFIFSPQDFQREIIAANSRSLKACKAFIGDLLEAAIKGREAMKLVDDGTIVVLLKLVQPTLWVGAGSAIEELEGWLPRPAG